MSQLCRDQLLVISTCTNNEHRNEDEAQRWRSKVLSKSGSVDNGFERLHDQERLSKPAA